MISDQTIVSAPAEKQTALGRRMVRRIITASMAAILTLPSLAAWGMDGPRNKLTAPGVQSVLIESQRRIEHCRRLLKAQDLAAEHRQRLTRLVELTEAELQRLHACRSKLSHDIAAAVTDWRRIWWSLGESTAPVGFA